MELSRPKLKKLLYISERNLQNLKKKNFSPILFIEEELFKHRHKRKKFLIFSLIKEENFLNYNSFL